MVKIFQMKSCRFFSREQMEIIKDWNSNFLGNPELGNAYSKSFFLFLLLAKILLLIISRIFIHPSIRSRTFIIILCLQIIWSDVKFRILWPFLLNCLLFVFLLLNHYRLLNLIIFLRFFFVSLKTSTDFFSSFSFLFQYFPLSFISLFFFSLSFTNSFNSLSPLSFITFLHPPNDLHSFF